MSNKQNAGNIQVQLINDEMIIVSINSIEGASNYEVITGVLVAIHRKLADKNPIWFENVGIIIPYEQVQLVKSEVFEDNRNV